MAMTAADVLVETLLDWGVDTIFGLPGDGINGIMESLRARQDKIRFIQVRHEEAAAFMACNSKASRPSEPRLHALVGCGVGLRLVVWHNHVLEHGKMLSVERHQWNLPLGRRRSD